MSASLPCFFTGAPANYQSHAEARLCEDVNSTWLGDYILSRGMAALRKSPRDSHSSQGLMNCAKQCLEVRKIGKVPFWLKKSESDPSKSFFVERAHFQPCVFEEFYDEPVDHSEKPNLLLESFANRLSKTGAFEQFNLRGEDYVWARLGGLGKEMAALIYYLRQNGDVAIWNRVDGHVESQNSIEKMIDEIKVQLTVAAWERLRQRNSFPFTNKVFIASAFEWPKNEEPQRLEVLAAIQRACSQYGYDAQLVSQGHTKYITDKIISEIRSAKFVVAELTYNNRGVYFEAGLARGYGKEVFHIVREDHIEGARGFERLHFDIKQAMYRKWNNPNQLEQVLGDWIGATVGRFNQVGP